MATETPISVNDEEYEVLATVLNQTPDTYVPERLRPALRSLRRKVEKA